MNFQYAVLSHSNWSPTNLCLLTVLQKNKTNRNKKTPTKSPLCLLLEGYCRAPWADTHQRGGRNPVPAWCFPPEPLTSWGRQREAAQSRGLSAGVRAVSRLAVSHPLSSGTGSPGRQRNAGCSPQRSGPLPDLPPPIHSPHQLGCLQDARRSPQRLGLQ